MFITFEGIDGCGKSTQIELLEETLQKKGYDVITTFQPGGTAIGQLIREIVLNPENTQIFPETELLLYIADRIQHIQEVIVPALKEKKIVLCDRYHDAAVAYQGGGRQLDLSWLEMLKNKLILTPDLTIWLDISIEESQKRLEQRSNDRLENEDIQFFQRVIKAYRDFSINESQRFFRIIGEDAIFPIQQKIQELVLSRLD